VKKRFVDEYAEVELGDARRSNRLRQLVEALSIEPARSFPEVLGDGAELEAAYRFLSNSDVTPDAVLSGHHRETAKRCEERKHVVIAHDTTDFAFKGTNRRGLGRLRGTREQGFFAHIALAISADEWREPLGVIAQETWIREKGKRKPSREWRHQHEDREPLRWLRSVEAAEHLLPGRAIHVMDREADLFDLVSKLVEGELRFIIRMHHDRKLADEPSLLDHLKDCPVRTQRVVEISARVRANFPNARKIHPERDARTATLGIKSTRVEIRRPRNVPASYPEIVRINVISVDEIKPPTGEAPVSWCLCTTESIATVRDLERIVDAYRCRWRVEEYFKALKTGCAIEPVARVIGFSMRSPCTYRRLANIEAQNTRVGRRQPKSQSTAFINAVADLADQARRQTSNEPQRRRCACGGCGARRTPPKKRSTRLANTCPRIRTTAHP
jgi:hypothetical protein